MHLGSCKLGERLILLIVMTIGERPYRLAACCSEDCLLSTVGQEGTLAAEATRNTTFCSPFEELPLYMSSSETPSLAVNSVGR